MLRFECHQLDGEWRMDTWTPAELNYEAILVIKGNSLPFARKPKGAKRPPIGEMMAWNNKPMKSATEAQGWIAAANAMDMTACIL
jgi:hypothetical protein